MRQKLNQEILKPTWVPAPSVHFPNFCGLLRNERHCVLQTLREPSRILSEGVPNAQVCLPTEVFWTDEIENRLLS